MSRHRIADAHYPPPGAPAQSAIACTCGHQLEAPTPELLNEAWIAHRRGDGQARVVAPPKSSIPGFSFGRQPV